MVIADNFVKFIDHLLNLLFFGYHLFGTVDLDSFYVIFKPRNKLVFLEETFLYCHILSQVKVDSVF